MRICWHSPGPWWPTGYGIQTALFAPRIAALGHQVVLSCMQRHPGQAGEFEGLPVVGPARMEFVLPVSEVRAALGGADPDLVIVCKDPWVLPAAQLAKYRTAVWANVDCEPLARPDFEFFRASGAIPVAVSRFGREMFADAGLAAEYIPHGIEAAAWPREPDKAAVRRELGLPEGAFVAGLCAQNVGVPSRKAFPEQFRGFAYFASRLYRGREAILLCHAEPDRKDGLNLRELAAALGITGSVRFASHAYMSHAQMLAWYQSLDVLLAATYGEGFGLPVVEALAAGIPVIATDCSALREKIGRDCGWLVGGNPWWNWNQRAWWRVPRASEISAALARAAGPRRPVPPGAAAEYDADAITAQAWKPFLEDVEATL